jgi:hypothetical protein
MFRLIKNFIDRFANWLILKFSDLTKKTRLKSKFLKRIRFDDELTKTEKDFFIAMFYNCKTALIWGFFEMKCIRSKVSSFIKLRTIKHKIWQNLYFQVFRVLIDLIVDIMRKKIKSEILKYCHESYKNLWFLIKQKKTNIALSMPFLNWIKSSFEKSIFRFLLKNFSKNLLIALCFSWLIFFQNMIKLNWMLFRAIWLFSWHL